MKLVIGIVRPEKANEVLEALYRTKVRGFSMSRVQGHGGELDRAGRTPAAPARAPRSRRAGRVPSPPILVNGDKH